MTKVALIGAAAGLVGVAALALGYQAGRTDLTSAAPEMSTITAPRRTGLKSKGSCGII